MRKLTDSIRGMAALAMAGLLALQTPFAVLADTPASSAQSGTGTSGAAASNTDIETHVLGGLLIEIQSVPAPSATTGLTYNGKTQTGAALPAAGKDYKLRSGKASAVLPGDYTLVVELIDPLPDNIQKQIAAASAEAANASGAASAGAGVSAATSSDSGTAATPSQYTVLRFRRWKGSGREIDTAPRTIRWSIAALKAKAPSGKKLSYTGKEQTGVAPASDGSYTISGHKATKPGSYKAVLKLAEGYVWSDGTTAAKEIVWSIEKPAETKPAETKPAETKPAETKPAETKPAETKPASSSGSKSSSGSRSSSSSGGSSSRGSATSPNTYAVVRSDGTTAIYTFPSANAAGSSTGSDASGNTASAQTGGAPTGTNLVPSAPGSTAPAQPGTASKLPQQNAAQGSGTGSGSSGNKAGTASGTAAASGKKSSASSGTSTGKPAAAANAVKPAETAAAKPAETSESKPAEETKLAELSLADKNDESQVSFEFIPNERPDGSSTDPDKDLNSAAGIAGAAAPHSWEPYELLNVLWKVLAVLGVLGIAGGSAYMVWNKRKNRGSDEDLY